MRKLIGALLTLTALSPLPAAAQIRADVGVQPQAEDRVDMGPRPDRAPPRDRGDRPDRDGGPGDAPRPPSPDRPQFDRPGGERPDRQPAAPRPGQGWATQGDGRPDRDDRQDDRRGDPRDRGGYQGQFGGQFGGQGYGNRDPRSGGPRPGDDRPDARPGYPRSGGIRPGDRNDWTRSRLDQRDDRWTRSRFEDRSAWNRGWRGDGRYDWNRYRDANRYAYRLPRYYAPGGWGGGYRRYGVGLSLNRALWAQNYWIADPYAYRLPEAYGPYRWVRYYDDALLVDLRSGIVVDAVYGIFW